MNKTLLVDAQNLLKRSFHGNQTTYTSFGNIGAIVTFYTSIRKVIKERQINKVVLFWDGANSGRLRHDIYPYYKSNRKNKNFYGEMILSDKDIDREESADNSILLQRERIKQYAEEFFFRQVEDQFCEADDCIAYYCLNLIQPDEEVLIFSNDRDFCQLIDDKVSFYFVNKTGDHQLVTKKGFEYHFDYALENATLMKAIEGCTSDMVYGVELIKEKSLLKFFPELKTKKVVFKQILERAKEINKGRKKPYKALENLINGKTSVLMENISNGEDLINLNYKLVNLREPMLTEECIEEIIYNCTIPISDEDRGGKNIFRLMYEDGFINSIPNGAEGYREYIIEFLPVVNKEKTKFKNYNNQ